VDAIESVCFRHRRTHLTGYGTGGYTITSDKDSSVTKEKVEMMVNTQLYEMALIREQEYHSAACRRARRDSSRLLANVARRLRRRS
jgi:hypothetical protein